MRVALLGGVMQADCSVPENLQFRPFHHILQGFCYAVPTAAPPPAAVVIHKDRCSSYPECRGDFLSRQHLDWK